MMGYSRQFFELLKILREKADKMTQIYGEKRTKQKQREPVSGDMIYRINLEGLQ